MQFFKHYHNARKTAFVRELMMSEGKEGYFHYMTLLEVLCDKFNGEDEKISVHLDDLLMALEIKQRKKLDKFLDKLNQVSTKVWEELGKVSVKKIRVSENFYFFEAPILFDLQGKDFKFATKQRQDSDPKNKEERIKIKEIREKKEEEEKHIAESCSNQSNFKTEILQPLEKIDESIPDEVMAFLTGTLMYPEKLIEEVRKDARLAFISSTDPKKEWRRFVGAYFKNESHKIRDRLVEMGKSLPKPAITHADCKLCDNSGRAVMIEKKSACEFAFQCTCTRGKEHPGLPEQWDGMSETYTHFKSWSVGNFDRKSTVQNHRASVAI